MVVDIRVQQRNLPAMPRIKRKRNWVVSAGLILVVVILVLTLRLVEDIGQEKLPGERFLIIRVLDGDTVELVGGDKVRLLSIDTPEKGERFYTEATELLERASLGKTARLEYSTTRRDRYGRLLAFVYIDDTLFANRMIIDSGLGYLYLFDDQESNLAQVQELLEAQRRALKKQLGLWGMEIEQEEYYLAVKNSHRFHRPGCKSISQTDEDRKRIFENRQAAVFEGLSPCRNCRP